jgi:class 3 adenylate cyclase
LVVETVVLYFTDVEGSTFAWASGAGMLRSLEEHDRVLRAAIARHAGVEFKHSADGLHATFPTVTAAVLAAVDGQRALAIVAGPWRRRPCSTAAART